MTFVTAPEPVEFSARAQRLCNIGFFSWRNDEFRMFRSFGFPRDDNLVLETELFEEYSRVSFGHFAFLRSLKVRSNSSMAGSNYLDDSCFFASTWYNVNDRSIDYRAQQEILSWMSRSSVCIWKSAAVQFNIFDTRIPFSKSRNVDQKA
jgi:hypothetical protein